MKNLSLIGFASGIGFYGLFKGYQSYFGKGLIDNKKHSFSEYMEQIGYTQPKLIQMKHRSDQLHFLHNFIIQNEKNVLNSLSVYFPPNIEQQILTGKVAEMSEQQKIDNIKVHLVFNASSHVQGMDGLVHGGFLATLLDNAFGYLSIASTSLTPAATAYLKLEHLKPVKINQDYIVSCRLEKVEGRKIFMRGEIKDAEGNIFVDSQTLFVTVNWGTRTSQNIDKRMKEQIEQQ